jgi:hypothetical protein
MKPSESLGFLMQEIRFAGSPRFLVVPVRDGFRSITPSGRFHDLVDFSNP